MKVTRVGYQEEEDQWDPGMGVGKDANSSGRLNWSFVTRDKFH